MQNNRFLFSVIISVLLINLTGVYAISSIKSEKTAGSGIHVIGVKAFPVAVPDYMETEEVPVKYYVRYVLDGRLEEIDVYSLSEADDLVRFLSGPENE